MNSFKDMMNALDGPQLTKKHKCMEGALDEPSLLKKRKGKQLGINF